MGRTLRKAILVKTGLTTIVELVTTFDQTRPKPSNMAYAVVELFAAGEPGSEDESYLYGGAGGGYSRKSKFSVASLSGIHLTKTGTALYARQNDSSGAVLALAVAGNNSSGVGDVRWNGGAGGQDNARYVGGGGGAGSAGNGSPGGIGGNGAPGPGAIPGYGSGGASPNYPGQPGIARITWSVD